MSEQELTEVRSVAANKRHGLFYGWVIVAASFPLIAISYGALYAFGVFLLPFQEYFSASAAVISGAYSTSILMYTAFGIPSGWVVDKYGPKVTTIAGGLLMALGLALTSLASSIWQLYLSYALIGVGMSPSYSPLMVTISRWFVRRRGLALGVLTVSIGVGPLIMTPVTTALVQSHGWRFALLVIAAAAVVVTPLALLLKKSPQDAGILPDGDMKPALPARVPELSGTRGLSMRQSFRARGFWQMVIIYFMIGLSLQMVMAHIVAYSQGKGVPPLTAAAVLSTISGVSIVGRLTMGFVSDRIGQSKTLALCVCIEGLVILWLITLSNTWMFFLFAVVFGFFYGGHVPQLPALVGDTLGLAHMGMVLGMTSFFWGLGGAIGPYLAGYIVDFTGSYGWAFIAGGAGLVFATMVALSVKKAVY